MSSEQIDTGELREQLRSGLWRTWAKVQAIAIGDELDALRAEVEKLTAERDAARTAARTLFVNMPPASISGNIIYDAPRKWQWLDEKGTDDAPSTKN